MIRAIRLELARPIGESWAEVGPVMRDIAKATPKLLNAAYEARVAAGVVGTARLKEAVAPDARAASNDGLVYQAVNRAHERLREWSAKKGAIKRWQDLDLPGGMRSAIARAACQAYGSRDHKQVRFSSERILVRGAETDLSRDESGFILSVSLRSKGRVKFALAHSRGQHRDALRDIVAGNIRHGDVKIMFDERQKKWFALLSYEPLALVVPGTDPTRALIVHRGIRNAFYVVSTTGHVNSMSGAKYMHQRRSLQSRQRDARRIRSTELGDGAKGHGKCRRLEHMSALEDKIARVTHTFCQQAAAWAAGLAAQWGCGTIVIEDYGGMPVEDDAALRRVLNRFPFYELKSALKSRCERDGLALAETSSAFISTTCPRCEACDSRSHIQRTGMFRCRACNFERPADFIASIWMARHAGVDMTIWNERFARERRLADEISKNGEC